MSNYGFGDEIEQGEPQIQDQGPKWFRDHMDKVSGQLSELKAENDRLKAAQQKQEVANTLAAQGYAPQVADLYTGKPEGLNEWLGTYGASLAKGDGSAVEQQGEAPAGPPATTVSPESQAAQAAFSAAGSGVAASGLSGDEQMAARLAATQTPEEWDAIMREAGNRMV